MCKKIMVAMMVVGLTGTQMYANGSAGEPPHQRALLADKEARLEEARLNQLRDLYAQYSLSFESVAEVFRMGGFGQYTEEEFRSYLRVSRQHIEAGLRHRREMEEMPPTERKGRRRGSVIIYEDAPDASLPAEVIESLPRETSMRKNGKRSVRRLARRK